MIDGLSRLSALNLSSSTPILRSKSDLVQSDLISAYLKLRLQCTRVHSFSYTTTTIVLGCVRPGCPKAGPYNCTEPNPEIQTIMAVLAGGPVGPGDR